MTPSQLSDLRRIAEEVPTRDWVQHGAIVNCDKHHNSIRALRVGGAALRGELSKTAAFVAAFNPKVALELLDEVERLREEVGHQEHFRAVMASQRQKDLATIQSHSDLYTELHTERDQLKAEVARLHDKYDLQLLVQRDERYRAALEKIAKEREPLAKIETSEDRAQYWFSLCNRIRQWAREALKGKP